MTFRNSLKPIRGVLQVTLRMLLLVTHDSAFCSQQASYVRVGRVAHCCEGKTRRHFPHQAEISQEEKLQPVLETIPVRNFYVGTNDPRVILCLTRQAEELESRGLYRRAATVWMAAFRESHSQPERNNFLARREQCLRKSSKRAVSGDEWYLSGNYVGA